METEHLPTVTESVAIVKKATRGTSNKNVNGNSEDRRRRKNYLLETYAADVAEVQVWWYQDEIVAITPVDPVTRTTEYPEVLLAKRNDLFPGYDRLTRQKACRCYRCGTLLVFENLTVDRIVPGCKKTARYPNGGTYVRENIRPCCGPCNSETGGAMATGKEHQAAKKRRVR